MKALEISNLTKVYSNGLKALEGVCLSVEKGDFFALLGPNGAGKSTTIGIIATLVNKTSGKVSVYGNDLDSNPGALKNCLGIVPQEFNFNIFEKVDNIIYQQAGYYGIPWVEAKRRADPLLKKLGLWEKRDEVSKSLSGGMKRKLMIVRALVHDPSLLVLDEPTAGVDVETRREMWDFLKELNNSGTTIILTTHYLEEAESLCKNVAIINGGKIIENSSMRNLLSRLDFEDYHLELAAPLNSPLPTITNHQVTLLDKQTLKITKPKSEDFYKSLSELHESGIKILAIKPAINRLEELFVRITNQSTTPP